MSLIRVRKDLKCPVCFHVDWCGINYERGFVICMRVVSNQPSKNGGYVHKLDNLPKTSPKREEPIAPTIDAEKIMRRWHSETTIEEFEGLAVQLGVNTKSLISLKCGWSPEYGAWGFPMRNSSGKIVGIRLRSESGKKWSVRGGHEGVFVPQSLLSLFTRAW